jgi:hypothetical protein
MFWCQFGCRKSANLDTLSPPESIKMVLLVVLLLTMVGESYSYFLKTYGSCSVPLTTSTQCSSAAYYSSSYSYGGYFDSYNYPKGCFLYGYYYRFNSYSSSISCSSSYPCVCSDDYDDDDDDDYNNNDDNDDYNVDFVNSMFTTLNVLCGMFLAFDLVVLVFCFGVLLFKKEPTVRFIQQGQVYADRIGNPFQSNLGQPTCLNIGTQFILGFSHICSVWGLFYFYLTPWYYRSEGNLGLYFSTCIFGSASSMMVRQLGGAYNVNGVNIVNVSAAPSPSLPQGTVIGVTAEPQATQGVVLPDLSDEQKRAIQAIINGDPSKKGVAI